jgi:hypothetical protein
MLDFMSCFVTYYGMRWCSLFGFIFVGAFFHNLLRICHIWAIGCCYRSDVVVLLFFESLWISTGRLFWRSWQQIFGCCITSIVKIRLYEKMKILLFRKKGWWLSSLKGLGIWCRVSVCFSNNILSPSPCSPPPCSLWPTNHILNFWGVVVVLRRVFLKNLPRHQRSIAWWWKSHAQKGEKKPLFVALAILLCNNLWLKLHGLGGVPTSKVLPKYANFFIHYISDFYLALSTFHATYYEAIHLRIAKEPSFLHV